MIPKNSPLYMTVYDYVITNIESGVFKKDTLLPTEQELADKFNVSKITSKKAYEMLVNKGYIRRVRGKGSYVIFDGKPQDRWHNSTAGSRIKTASSQMMIGVVMSDFDSSYGEMLISGIEERAAQDDIFVVLKRSNGNQEKEEIIIKQFMQLGVDGIIVIPLNGENYNNVILQMVVDKYPFVVLDRFLRGIAAPFVGSDNHNAAKVATDYLFELGHRRIGFLTSLPDDTSTIAERIEGFTECFTEHNIIVDKSLFVSDICATLPGFYSKEQMDKDLTAIRDFLIKNRDVTCLFATEYNIALLAHKATTQVGLTVPGDISILCFDSPYNKLDSYYYTHVRQQEADMGRAAVEALINQISGQNLSNKKIIFESQLIIGQTTRSVKH